MRNVAAAVVFGLALAGCVSSQSKKLNDATASLTAAKAKCDVQTFRTRTEAARCANEAEEAYLLPAFPYPDLVRLKIATRTALAEKVDRGQITQAEADLEMARQMSQASSEIEKRTLAKRAVGAQESAASSLDRATRQPSICSYTQAGVNCL